MIFISHRGNILEKDKTKENKIDYIENALSLGFDVEVDIWYIDNMLYLGHDNPCTEIDLNFLNKNKDKLWVHCKNIDSLIYLKNKDLNYFWHESDKVSVTSKGILWAYPSKEKIRESIDVLPETFSEEKYEFKTIGICSDFIQKYRDEYKKILA